jgi:pyruvate,orthophosphate dikinase
MMDTVLNLGLNDVTVEALAKSSGDARFAYDSYRRFITMYSDVVLEVGHDHFEEILEMHKEQKGYVLDTDLSADDWAELIKRYKKRVKEETGSDFPQEPAQQLWGAIGAVFGSWMNQRAITYRRLHAIPESWGTAVNVQAMVFGNMGDTSATGVAFTRNPSTGEKSLYGEFLINAQGEDVVAGIRTPQEITEAARQASGSDKPSMEQAMPEAYAAHPHLSVARETLSRHAGPRVHGRERQAVDAADAFGQAHGKGGAADCGGARQRGADLQGRSGDARRPGSAGPVAASDHRSESGAQDHRHRPSRVARCGIGRDRVFGG